MYCGWLDDSIWRLADSEWYFFRELPYALVTCIDSTPDVKSTTTARKIVASRDSCSFIGDSLVVGNAELLDVALRYDLFTHFDEVWLYTGLPSTAKPSGTSIVSPTDLSVEPPPAELAEWFSVSGCLVGLGDGIGMNYMTHSRDVLHSLKLRQEE